ncbi:MAG: caspase family protein [Balneolaceae bacterium]
MIYTTSRSFLPVFACIFWGLLYSSNGYSQTAAVDVYFQDFHTAEVTHVEVSNDGNWFFSADRTGKVLMWNANDFTVYKTLTEGYGAPINSMRLNPAGDRLIYSMGQGGRPQTGKAGRYRELWFTLRYNFSDAGSADTLYSIPLFASDGELPGKVPAVIDIQGYSSDRHLIYTIYGEQPYLAVYNDGELMYQHPVSYSAGHVAYHEDKKLFALAAAHEEQPDGGIQNRYKLEIRSSDRFDVMTERDFGNHPIVDLRFHPQDEQLFVVAHDTEREAVVVYVYDVNTFNEIDRGVFEYQNRNRTLSAEVTAADISFDNGVRILVTNRYSESFLIRYDAGEGFSHSVVKEEEGGWRSYLSGAYLPLQDRLVLFEGAGFHESPEMVVYDVQRNRFLDRFYRQALPKAIGEFLPDDSWLITNRPDLRSFETFFKYYPSGSIMNRFSRNSFTDYMELHHQLRVVQSGMPVDRTTGEMAFLAVDPKTSVSSFYLYDLIEGDIQRHASAMDSYTNLQQFRSQSGRILLANHETPAGYAIARRDSVKTIDGDFLQAHLSLDGEYLITYSKEQEVRLIRLDTGNVVFTHSIDEQLFRITIHPIEGDGFWLSYSWFDGGQKNRTLVLTKEEGNRHTITQPENSDFFLEDFSYANGMFAALEGNYGMVFLSNEQFLQLEAGLRPSKVSLNSDGSRLMVSLNDGTIRIYDTERLDELARMIHPGRQDQLIIQSDGYYSSNTDAGRWLAARTPQGDPLPFYIAEPLNRPDKVIHSLGSPKPEMVEMLERAAVLRRARSAVQSALQQTESVPEIVSVLLDGGLHTSVSTQKELPVTLRLYDESSHIISLRVTLNGVPVQPELSGMPVSPGTPSEVSFKLPLVNGENVIQFQAYNSDGTSSFIRERTVEFASEQKPDLYLLAVGVSEYSDEALNLTFADKDAWDMALLFGDSASVDLTAYKDTFYGNRYAVYNHLSRGEFDVMNVSHHSDLRDENLFQADIGGRFWIEREWGEKDLFWMWDFENLTRRELHLPGFTDRSWSPLRELLIPDPAGKETIYVDTLNRLTLVDNESFSVVKHPLGEYEFDDLFAYKPGRFIGQLSRSAMNALETEKPFYRVEITDDSLTITGLEIESDGFSSLKAVSSDGETLLVETLSDLKIVYVNDSGLERRLTGFKRTGFDQTFAFSEDNKTVKGLRKRRGGENQQDAWVLYERPLNRAETDSTVFPALSRYHGVNIHGGELTRLESSPPPARFQSFFDSDRLDVIHRITPESFENTYTRVLTNRFATAENVKHEMNTFLKRAGPDDQIIVFLAGHGVLDSDYTYYFAPTDMDFDDPQSSGIAYDDIVSAISSSASTRRLLLMDTCHAGEVYDMQTAAGDANRFHTESARTIISGQQDLYVDSPADIMSLLFDQTGSENGITVLAASGGAEVAYESTECADLNNGAFTSSIIDYITGRFGPFYSGMEERERFSLPLGGSFIEEVNNQVMRLTCNRQIPNTREINRLSDIRLW